MPRRSARARPARRQPRRMRTEGSMTALAYARLRELLHYDPETGLFTWRVTRTGTARAGSLAGWRMSDGYIRISLGERSYLAHRLAWLYVTGEWPPGYLDHRDTDKDNNRWCNLRPATRSQNGANARRPSHNTSGFKGVTRHRGDRKWAAQIRVHGQIIHLGRFVDLEDARAAYVSAAQHHFG